MLAYFPDDAIEVSKRLEAGTANGDLPNSKRQLNPTSLGQLSGDDLVKSVTSSWPLTVVGLRRSIAVL